VTVTSARALDLAAAYRSIRLIRRAEEEVARVYPTDVIKSPIHLSIGQEAVAVGVCQALRPDDVLFATYRSHATYLAKGGDLKRFMAELYGKDDGCARGKGGSMHMIDVAAGVMGTSAVVAATISHAVGAAYAFRQQGRSSLAVAFFGDGATEEGVFFESLNLAQLKRLPVLFVCENNGYAIHTPLAARQARADIGARAAAFGIPARQVAWNDVQAIHAATAELVDELRERRDGPRFLECVTYRWREHVGPGEDWSLGYRSRDEAALWIERDEMLRVGALLDPAGRAAIDAEVERAVADAIAFAEASPFPKGAELYTDSLAE